MTWRRVGSLTCFRRIEARRACRSLCSDSLAALGLAAAFGAAEIVFRVVALVVAIRTLLFSEGDGCVRTRPPSPPRRPPTLASDHGAPGHTRSTPHSRRAPPRALRPGPDAR